MSLTDTIASRYLGKKVEGCNFYNPSLLVPIPRIENRIQYGINNDNLPFDGFDVWHAYEFSALTGNGIPVTRLLKLKYSCNSEFLIESKSLKLYLNSFNMSKFGRCIDECLEICGNIIEKDLSEALKTQVELSFLDNDCKKVQIYNQFVNLFSQVNEKDIKADSYSECPECLSVLPVDGVQEHYLTFDSLRSNCRVTHQPDFGDVFIYYKSKKRIEDVGLIKYLISFRSEFHFHEECCEMIYKRLSDLLDDGDKLFVSALYTRRGGIDISPVRSNCGFEIAQDLLDLSILARYGIKQ